MFLNRAVRAIQETLSVALMLWVAATMRGMVAWRWVGLPLSIVVGMGAGTTFYAAVGILRRLRWDESGKTHLTGAQAGCTSSWTCYTLACLVKRSRALLGSNPTRDNQAEGASWTPPALTGSNRQGSLIPSALPTWYARAMPPKIHRHSTNTL